MKVGLYTVSLFRQVTGIEKVGLLVAKALIADGHSIVWITPAGPIAPVETLPPGVSVEHLPYGITSEHAEALRSIAERRKLDVVVAMATNGVVSIFPLALEELDTAFVFSEHNQPEFYVEPWWGIGQELHDKMAMRDAVIHGADRVHVLRESCAPAELVDTGKVHVIPNAVLATNQRAHFPSSTERNRFISIGRLSPEKGLSDAIQAFSLLESKLPSWDYAIFGEGPLLPKLKKLAHRLGLSKRVQFMGHTESPLEELAASQLLLMPSKFEGWPLVAGEAQSVGLPLVGFRDCEALAEAFGQAGGGLLIEQRSASDLADAIYDLASSTEQWVDLSHNGLKSAQARTPEIIGQQWLKLIREAVQEKSSEKPSSPIDFLKSKFLEQHESHSDQTVTIGKHLTSGLTALSKDNLKVAAKSLKNGLVPTITHYGKASLRQAARLSASSKITLFSLPGIEDGPRHLQEHLQSEPHVVYDSVGQRLSPQDYLKLLTSRVVVTEGGLPQIYRSKQQVVQIWHSTGFIKRAANLKLGLKEDEFREKIGDFNFVVAPSEAMVPVYAEAFCVPTSRVLPLGSIKTDFLCDPLQKSALKDLLIGKLPDLKDKRIYVFAPTFRGRWPDCLHHYSSINLDEVNESLGENERLVVTLHPQLAASPIEERKRRTNLVPLGRQDKIIDAQLQGLDAHTLLAAADIFISDYSGGLLDAIAGHIPTLCFADDLEHYAKELTPGFIEQIPNSVTHPGTLAFLNGIEKAQRPDDEKLKAFRNQWVGSCDGKAGARLAGLVEGL